MDKKNQDPPPARPAIEKWKTADKNHDGFISLDEFTTIPRIQKLPEEKRARIFKRLDKDADDKLSSTELGRLHKRGDKHGPPMKHLWELDTDKSGGISFEEFKAGPMFMKLAPERQQAVFRRLDADSDGMITTKDHPKRPEEKPRVKRPEDSNPKPGNSENPEGNYHKLDLNGDGALSFDEFRKGAAVKDLTEDQQEDRFEELDRNKDLKLSPEDFPPPASPSPHNP